MSIFKNVGIIHMKYVHKGIIVIRYIIKIIHCIETLQRVKIKEKSREEKRSKKRQ